MHGVFLVAPRAYWKGYLKLSLVSCPISLFPATSEREKISFHQLHKQTGNRIKYKKVDAETGREVEADDIIKGTRSAKGSTSKLIGGTRRGRAGEQAGHRDRRVRPEGGHRRAL